MPDTTSTIYDRIIHTKISGLEAQLDTLNDKLNVLLDRPLVAAPTTHDYPMKKGFTKRDPKQVDVTGIYRVKSLFSGGEWNQKQIALLTGYSESTVCRIIAGKYDYVLNPARY
jgi:hypothetical protein